MSFAFGPDKMLGQTVAQEESWFILEMCKKGDEGDFGDASSSARGLDVHARILIF
jgi:hypothetical protein